MLVFIIFDQHQHGICQVLRCCYPEFKQVSYGIKMPAFKFWLGYFGKIHFFSLCLCFLICALKGQGELSQCIELE